MRLEGVKVPVSLFRNRALSFG